MFAVRLALALGCNVASSGARRARMSAVALSMAAKTACAFSASTLSANRTRPVAVSCTRKSSRKPWPSLSRAPLAKRSDLGLLGYILCLAGRQVPFAFHPLPDNAPDSLGGDDSERLRLRQIRGKQFHYSISQPIE